MTPDVDVIVIGAGIGGLATARELVDRGVPAHRVLVVGRELGGRLRTIRTTAGHLLEAGAGRYSRVMHPRLDNLLHAHGLSVDPFRFEMSRSGCGTPAEALAGFDLAGLVAGGGFHAALAGRIGARAADAFCTATGYEALRAPDFPVAGGIEVARTHPECAVDPDRFGWMRPIEGFGTLVGRLTADLRGRGVQVLTGVRATRVRRVAGGVAVELKAGGRRQTVSAGSAVLAMAPSAVDGIGLPSDADISWRPHTRSVELFKGFLVYDRPWWDAMGLRQRCLVTGDAVRKLYFDSARCCIFFYCDSAGSRYWERLRRSGPAAFRRELFRSIEAVAGPHLAADLRRPSERHARFWPSGIDYLTDDAPGPANGVVGLTDEITLTSDSLTDNPGWVEGALSAASIAAVRALDGSRGRRRPVRAQAPAAA